MKKKVYIDEERALDQTRSMGNVKTILNNGEYNVWLIDKYTDFKEGIFVAHDKIIVGSSIGILKSRQIEIPEFLQIKKDIDLSLVPEVMKEFGFTQVEAIKKVEEWSNPPLELPEIAEASVIHIDLVQKRVEYIIPGD